MIVCDAREIRVPAEHARSAAAVGAYLRLLVEHDRFLPSDAPTLCERMDEEVCFGLVGRRLVAELAEQDWPECPRLLSCLAARGAPLPPPDQLSPAARARLLRLPRCAALKRFARRAEGLCAAPARPESAAAAAVRETLFATGETEALVRALVEEAVDHVPADVAERTGRLFLRLPAGHPMEGPAGAAFFVMCGVSNALCGRRAAERCEACAGAVEARLPPHLHSSFRVWLADSLAE